MNSNFIEPITIASSLFNKYYKNKNHDLITYRSDYILMTLLIENQIQLDAHLFRNDLFCGMLILDESEKTIVHNSSHSEEKRNFTIAHELGHYYLHKDKQSQFVDETTNMLDNSNLIFEQQANAFAAELLLPQDVLSLMFSYRYNFFRIAKITRVSYECLHWRLVTYLKQKLSLNKKESLLIIENYVECSKTKSQEKASIFNIVFMFGYTPAVRSEVLRLEEIVNSQLKGIPL
ncbi:ImmA/IrrE family metallo-endopeptidase [Paenibacillus antarcticus]|uniref:IrrE N-terminal-like domain-containing protein n=1 Tax=Paenibacillus antarcticus TaxID=253703 RepID=A0A168PAR1_9BACL|nr:ImmA/IrrE family metallo-endopeptidase [Paenibacillus antarcticus]OAB46574.1 hypothetical protein PBAT_11200 [Paenibacillus antarcticus]